MIEARGNLWTYEPDGGEGRLLRCVTTNGATRRDGAAVMGRGCAAEAKQRIPGIEHKLGELLDQYGNRVFRLCSLADGSHLASFPVKTHWKQKADLELIERSAGQLIELVEKFSYAAAVLPRPGCGNGGRHFHSEVKPLLEQVLAGRGFVVISY